MIGIKLSDRYEIVSELGRGGMGVVYMAKDPRLNRDVAVKLIPPTMLTPETENRFQHEAQLVAQMDHPSIVSIHDFGRHDGSLFFVMPVVRGTTLREVMREGALKLGEVIDIGIQVAEALAYSHGRDVIHRDIKPENIMISREGGGLRLRVMDFGLAQAPNVTRLTKTGTLVGTMSYVSPEQVAGRTIDPRSDVYALGTVLYECASGDVPFTGELQSVLYRIVHELPAAPSQRGAQVDPDLEGLIMRCLEKDPQRRPQTAEEVARALSAYRSGIRDSREMQSVMVTRSMTIQRPALAPFVGRVAELREIQQRLNQAIEGKCQFVVLAGEPGVGKTRLLDELEELAHARQIRVLHGRPVEREAAFPYYGFCEAIQDYFQQKETGSSSSGLPDLSDLAADLIGLFPMLSEIEPIRSAAAGPSQLATAREPQSPESHTQIFELLARTLTRLAGGKPLVLVLEDLHGAEASVEALQYIVRRLAPTPTLVIGTYRSTEVDKRHPLNKMLAGFRGDRQFASIQLEPMSPDEHRGFLATLIGGNEIEDGLARQLYEASEGNPFFTKELVRSLLDSGDITQNDTGAWALSGGMQISSEALPATIQQAVEERIGRLPDDLREVLSIASVMGRSFDFKDLEKLADSDDDLDRAVDRLVQEGLIEEVRQTRGDRLAFTSGVVRDVLYGELSRRRRRSLHRRYAKDLERRHAGRLEGVYPQLVYHYTEGDEPEKAVEYGMLHAKRSLDTFSPEEAIRSAKAALEFLDREWEGDRALEGEARMLLAAGHQLAGDVGASLREFDAALKVFDREKRPDRALDALLAGSRAAWQARKADDAASWVERGIEASRARNDSEALRQFLTLGGTLASLRGEYARANEYSQEAERLGPEPASAAASEEVPRGGRLVVGLANRVRAARPVEYQFVEEFEVFSNVFETLLTTNADGSLVPRLCENWEVRDEGRSIVFRLREGVEFHDGHELSAEQVKRSLEEAARMTTDLPPALAVIDGAAELASGGAGEIRGLVAHAARELEIRLAEPLPIYPAFLTDGRAAIVRVGADGAFAGTGPFQVESTDEGTIKLTRNDDHWSDDPARLDAIEFRTGLSAKATAEGFRSGELDVVGNLLLEDFEEIARDPRHRRCIVEAPGQFTYFVLFNVARGPAAQNEELRRILTGVARPHVLVWRTLGRLAHPATGLLPPGILGHDPGKRRTSLARDEAKQLLEESGVPTPVRLNAAVHPTIRDRYGSLLEALLAVWKEIGVEVDVTTADQEGFARAKSDNEAIDLYVGRFAPNYQDPDNFAYTLFHSGTGEFARYFSSEETDRLVEDARTETRPSVREGLYRKFENLLIDRAVLLPLFYDVDYRVSAPSVRGLELGNTDTVVNYHAVGKVEGAAERAEDVQGDVSGELVVPMTGTLDTIDPSLCNTLEQAEVVTNVYETLTRDMGEARVLPWLAERFDIEDGGRRYRFHLRSDVRFHDGRKLTSRDVRYSVERLLQSENVDVRGILAPIAGAKALSDGEASELSGFVIHSASEFSIALDKPVSFFPQLLASPQTAIVSEGGDRFGTGWNEGNVGTGPFRVVSFEPGRRLELERNPLYWRQGHPRVRRLEFVLRVPSREIVAGFRAGRFSLAADLFPAEMESLRRDPELGAGYRDKPRLTTYFLVCNPRSDALRDLDARRHVFGALDTPALVRQSLGKLAFPAQGLIPPGLLGHGSRPAAARRRRKQAKPLELTMAVHPIFRGEYSEFFEGLLAALGEAGVKVRQVGETIGDYLDALWKGATDLALGRWNADYPDADTFVYVLHSRDGMLGPFCGEQKIDELVEQGRGQPDPQARHAIYRRIEEMIADEARLLALFHEQAYRFARPEVEGLRVTYWSPVVAYDELRVESR